MAKKEIIEEDADDLIEEVSKEIKSVPAIKPTARKDRYELVEVPVQTQIAFRDTTTNNVIDEKIFLLNIANDIAAIKKALG